MEKCMLCKRQNSHWPSAESYEDSPKNTVHILCSLFSQQIHLTKLSEQQVVFINTINNCNQIGLSSQPKLVCEYCNKPSDIFNLESLLIQCKHDLPCHAVIHLNCLLYSKTKQTVIRGLNLRNSHKLFFICQRHKVNSIQRFKISIKELLNNLELSFSNNKQIINQQNSKEYFDLDKNIMNDSSDLNSQLGIKNESMNVSHQSSGDQSYHNIQTNSNQNYLNCSYHNYQQSVINNFNQRKQRDIQINKKYLSNKLHLKLNKRKEQQQLQHHLNNDDETDGQYISNSISSDKIAHTRVEIPVIEDQQNKNNQLYMKKISKKSRRQKLRVFAKTNQSKTQNQQEQQQPKQKSSDNLHFLDSHQEYLQEAYDLKEGLSEYLIQFWDDIDRLYFSKPDQRQQQLLNCKQEQERLSDFIQTALDDDKRAKIKKNIDMQTNEILNNNNSTLDLYQQDTIKMKNNSCFTVLMATENDNQVLLKYRMKNISNEESVNHSNSCDSNQPIVKEIESSNNTTIASFDNGMSETSNHEKYLQQYQIINGNNIENIKKILTQVKLLQNKTSGHASFGNQQEDNMAIEGEAQEMYSNFSKNLKQLELVDIVEIEKNMFNEALYQQNIVNVINSMIQKKIHQQRLVKQQKSEEDQIDEDYDNNEQTDYGLIDQDQIFKSIIIQKHILDKQIQESKQLRNYKIEQAMQETSGQPDINKLRIEGQFILDKLKHCQIMKNFIKGYSEKIPYDTKMYFNKNQQNQAQSQAQAQSVPSNATTVIKNETQVNQIIPQPKLIEPQSQSPQSCNKEQSTETYKEMVYQVQPDNQSVSSTIVKINLKLITKQMPIQNSVKQSLQLPFQKQINQSQVGVIVNDQIKSPQQSLSKDLNNSTVKSDIMDEEHQSTQFQLKLTNKIDNQIKEENGLDSTNNGNEVQRPTKSNKYLLSLKFKQQRNNISQQLLSTTQNTGCTNSNMNSDSSEQGLQKQGLQSILTNNDNQSQINDGRQKDAVAQQQNQSHNQNQQNGGKKSKKGGKKTNTNQLETDCQICFSNIYDDNDNNPVVYCSQCQVSFHKYCYGLQTIPEGPFYCETCASFLLFKRSEKKSIELQLQSGFYKCNLCTVKGLPLKKMPDHNWYHPQCLFLNNLGIIKKNDLGFRKENRIKDIISKKVLQSSLYPCYICHQAEGIKVKCCYQNCLQFVHVSCAFLNGNEMKLCIKPKKDTQIQKQLVELEEEKKKHVFNKISFNDNYKLSSNIKDKCEDDEFQKLQVEIFCSNHCRQDRNESQQKYYRCYAINYQGICKFQSLESYIQFIEQKLQNGTRNSFQSDDDDAASESDLLNVDEIMDKLY